MRQDAIHVLIVLLPFLLLPVAGWLGGRRPRARLLALVPAALAVYYGGHLVRLGSAEPLRVELPWAEPLGLALSFYLDGLGLLFALLITGIGSLVVLYAVDYLGDHPFAGRFQATLFAFMGSMLGVVLSDNVLLLFVFWELTGFTSYFLIAFQHDRRRSRHAALQALLVTGAGGLALLAAGVLLRDATGLVDLSALRAGGALGEHPRYVAAVLLVLLAAFTKSAQFPFHFWLPNAMAAPSPVSAYLHSATMVKAGIYLVARMTPMLGGTPLWTGMITTVAAVTLLGAAYRSVVETDLKRILAYTTVAALGAMMLLLGLGSRTAVAAGLLYLVAHACYKGALFLAAGAIDHGAGTRDVRVLRGLLRVMPATAAAAILAALSMAGIPPFVGFIAKEQLYESLRPPGMGLLPPAVLLAIAVAASALMGASGLRAGVSPFVGSTPQPAGAHQPPATLWIPPLVLAVLGLAAGIVPALTEAPLSLATRSVVGPGEPVHLALWHGFTPALALSGLTVLATLLLFWQREPVQRGAWRLSLRTERLYSITLAGLDAFSRRIGPVLQAGSLRGYVRVIIATPVLLLLVTYSRRGFPEPGWHTPVRFHEAGLAMLIMLAAISAARARSAMGAVLSLGAAGYCLALMYVLYSAPDLAATQFAVETLTVVLFVLVFRHLRGFDSGSTPWGRARDALIGGTAGFTIALLVLVTAAEGITSRLADWFVLNAPARGHGRNVVNVILVDFRAFDTLGEITVLVTVAIGVRALLSIGRDRAR